ncbi:hypothetical protein KEJ21_02735 [Candidatus Bathyarchaeota archaeon]|nr:hypothetical protein [Candidatus Bathyarchaeota archaeon]MBS7629970.1 hypothetical protein [Candidatus Bathyarchaeota archaeon]
MSALDSTFKPFTFLGLMLIILGLILVAIPFISRFIPNIERVPWILLWVYRKDGFVFVTSPLLIIISLISLIVHLLSR